MWELDKEDYISLTKLGWKLDLSYSALYKVIVYGDLVETTKINDIISIHKDDIEIVRNHLLPPEGFVKVRGLEPKLGYSIYTIFKYLKDYNFQTIRVRETTYMREEDIIPLGNIIFDNFYKKK